jgi:hypothetical protein
MTDEYVKHGYVTRPDQGVRGGGSEVKASGRSTSGSLTVIEIVVDGQTPTRQTHTREDESVYVLTAHSTSSAAGTVFRGRAGLVCVPAPRTSAHLPVDRRSRHRAVDRRARRAR